MCRRVSSFFDVSSWSLVTAGTVTLISIDRVVLSHAVDYTMLIVVGLVYEAFTFNLVFGHAMYFGLHWVTR